MRRTIQPHIRYPMLHFFVDIDIGKKIRRLRMEVWEKALAKHEKECAERYQGIEKQFGDMMMKLSNLDGKFTIILWISGYMALLLSAIALRAFFV